MSTRTAARTRLSIGGNIKFLNENELIYVPSPERITRKRYETA